MASNHEPWTHLNQWTAAMVERTGAFARPVFVDVEGRPNGLGTEAWLVTNGGEYVDGPRAAVEGEAGVLVGPEARAAWGPLPRNAAQALYNIRRARMRDRITTPAEEAAKRNLLRDNP